METSDAVTSSEGMDNHTREVVATICRVILIGLVLVGLAVAILTPPVLKAREAARRTSCKCQLKILGLALHNYHDAYGSFPPAFVRGPDGRPWHSWRVLILPYLDQAPMYKQYKFTEPWDGPNNRKLLPYMPVSYICASRPPCVVPTAVASISRGVLACIDASSPTGGYTSYAAVLGPDCVFRGAQSSTLKDLVDGTSNTLLIGECARTKIPWMKPDDIDITLHPTIGDPDGFSSFHPGGAQFLLGDGTVRFLSSTISQPLLDALYTRNGGETVGDF